MPLKNKKKFKWGGVREECQMIKKHADKWCRDNGYPIRTRLYVYTKHYDKKA